MMKRNSMLALVSALLTVSAFVSGCARGEDDPWLSLHSRDARLSQTWSLASISGTVIETTGASSTNIDYEFDGVNLYITTNGQTESFKYQYDIEVKDNGEIFSQEFKNDFTTDAIVSHSSKTSFWYWGNDDKNKTSVNLDITGILDEYLSYDIPRLAYNDMTLSVDYSDNYTELIQVNDSTFNYVAGSETVNLELKWEVNLDGI